MAFIRIEEQTEPATPASGTDAIYVDSADGLLSMKKDDGSVTKFSIADATLSRIGASTYSTLQHLMNAALSAGVFSGGNVVVSASPNAVDVSSGTGFIKAVDSDVATLSFFDWPASPALSVPINTTRYIGVEYNSGSPIVTTRTTEDFDIDTEFPLAVVTNESGTIYISLIPWLTGDAMGSLIERFDSIALVSRDNRVGGLILSNTGTRNVMVSAGTLLARMSEFPLGVLNTSTVDTFDAYYLDGVGGLQKQSALTQWDNTKYDDGTGTLASLTAGFYSSRWFYLQTDGSLIMIYGHNNDAALGDALNDTTPSLIPERTEEGGLLIGRIIAQEGTDTPAAVQTVFETNFSASSVTAFSDLAGFATPSQGGTGVINDDASTLTINGAYPIDFTISGATSLTLPTSGILITDANTLDDLASTTSSQLASVISDETGTGSLVFADSPALVTPDLGTPSALVGTNITGTASGLTAGTVTTNANLTGAVTSVGNATSLGSFSSSDLSGALTDETGSGSAVFSDSPTLVTPALGTPSAVTLTNATGLPLTTGVTGTLAVTNGGTGATTFTDAGVLIGNGTGAVQVTTAGTSGQVLTSNGAGVDPTFQDAPNAFSNKLLHIQDQKAQNTDGGTFTSGAWRTRDLNTVLTNEITGASLATNQITLPSGTYWCEWFAPSFEDGNTANAHQSRLQNITDATTILLGQSACSGNNNTTISAGAGRFTLASSKVIELQHQNNATQASNGFGRPANFTTEIYSRIRIWKIA